MISRSNGKPRTLGDALQLYFGWAPDLRRRTMQRMAHDVRRAVKVWGEITPDEITSAHFAELRRVLVIDSGLAVSTVENTVAMVWTILRFLAEVGMIDSCPSKGRVMRRPAPSLLIPSIEEFSAVYSQAHVTMWPRLCHDRQEWWQAFLATAYFTALRLSDLLALRWDWIDAQNRIILQAEKTGKKHIIPVHPVLARHLSFMPRVNDRIFSAAKSSIKQMRREMRRMADAAGVPYITPQQIRRLSVNVWEKARPGCGLLIQGSGFRGSARHYLNPQIQLVEAVPLLEVPPAMIKMSERQLRLF